MSAVRPNGVDFRQARIPGTVRPHPKHHPVLPSKRQTPVLIAAGTVTGTFVGGLPLCDEGTDFVTHRPQNNPLIVAGCAYVTYKGQNRVEPSVVLLL